MKPFNIPDLLALYHPLPNLAFLFVSLRCPPDSQGLRGSLSAIHRDISTLANAVPPSHGAPRRNGDQRTEEEQRCREEGDYDSGHLDENQSSSLSFLFTESCKLSVAAPSHSLVTGSSPSPSSIGTTSNAGSAPPTSSLPSSSSTASLSIVSKAGMPSSPPSFATQTPQFASPPSSAALTKGMTASLSALTTAVPSLSSSFDGAKPVSQIAKGIKTASGVIEGLKAADVVIRKLQEPQGLAVVGLGFGPTFVVGLKAARFIAKGLKFSKEITKTLQEKNLLGHSGIASKSVQERVSTMIKGFNAFYGAFRMMQFARGLVYHPQAVQFLHWNILFKSYELSKSVLNILDVVVKWKGGVLIALGKEYYLFKGMVGALSVITKAAFLYRELCIVMLQKLLICGGTIAAFGMKTNHFRQQWSHTHFVVSRRESTVQFSGVKDLTASLWWMSESRTIQFSSLIVLQDYVSEYLKDKRMQYCSIAHPSDIFSLAIPIGNDYGSRYLPSSEIFCCHPIHLWI